MSLSPAFDLRPEAVVKSQDQLAWAIHEAFKEPYLILSAIASRLDQIESAANKSLWERL